MNETGKATDIQIGGDHYKKYPIQPIDFIVANNLSFLAGNAIKYITRYKDKNGEEDIKKARHYLDLILEYEFKKPILEYEFKKPILEYEFKKPKQQLGPYIVKEGCPACEEAPLAPGEWR